MQSEVLAVQRLDGIQVSNYVRVLSAFAQPQGLWLRLQLVVFKHLGSYIGKFRGEARRCFGHAVKTSFTSPLEAVDRSGARCGQSAHWRPLGWRRLHEGRRQLPVMDIAVGATNGHSRLKTWACDGLCPMFIETKLIHYRLSHPRVPAALHSPGPRFPAIPNNHGCHRHQKSYPGSLRRPNSKLFAAAKQVGFFFRLGALTAMQT